MSVKDGAHTTFGRIRKVMSRLKISAISYLNTAPLMWDFEHTEAGADLLSKYDVSYTIPSACAAALRAGTADIGIIPAAAYTTVRDLIIVPGVAIAARCAVRSILLVSRSPVDTWDTRVRSVALDTSSMTSVALTKILFAKWLGGAREYNAMPPDLDAMLGACDCALLIGDPALHVDRNRYFTLDLAEEWNMRTGKSFVFAFWAISKRALPAVARSRAVAREYRVDCIRLGTASRLYRRRCTQLSDSEYSLLSGRSLPGGARSLLPLSRRSRSTAAGACP
jgi:chorismate dehydratase